MSTPGIEAAAENSSPLVNRAESRIQRMTSAAPERTSVPMTTMGGESRIRRSRYPDRSAAAVPVAPAPDRIRRSTTGPRTEALPAPVRLGVEALSGFSMGDVRVHYDSPRPARFGAHAYAEGSDIHLGPGHAGELPHEAWHVVQQKRGEVAPQLTLRNHAANVDAASEAEADGMGALAARRGGRATDPAPVHQAVRRAVLQLRMPAMDEKAIRANPNVARELLIHRLRTIPDAEFQAMKVQLPDLQPPRMFLDIFENKAVDVDSMVSIYPLWYGSTTAATKYAAEDAASSEPTESQRASIIKLLPAIVDGVERTIANKKALSLIFGVNPPKDGESEQEKARRLRIMQVLKATKASLQCHIDKQTCPVLVLGNEKHNAWIGVSGHTAEGKVRVDLGSAAVTQLASGTAQGQASLVHEFTHAAAGTNDEAYGLPAMAKLGPALRVENASHYEHAYLETVESTNPDRYYQPAVSIGQAGPKETPVDAMRNKKVLAAKGLLDTIYNRLDNMYLAAQTLSQKPHQATADHALARSLALFPHGQDGRPLSDNAALAIIEDRTRYVAELSDGDRLFTHVKAVDESTLKSLEPAELVSSIIAKELRLDNEAPIWVHYLLNPKEWQKDNRGVGK